MKNRIYALLLAFLPLISFAQSVPFPSGNGRDYNAIEPYGYSDTGQGWNTSNYLPFIYHGIWFRMMLPNGVTYNSTTKTFTNANPGTTYPLILFFHGRGEVGTDNNKQLVHGGELHKNAVLSGAFPGFLLYPQSVGADGGKDVLLKVIEQLPVDFNRIYVHGLSNGGQETWKFTIANPGLVAAAFPMSAADLNATTNNNLLYTPLRESQGELDTNPSPAYGQQVKDWFDANGGHLEYFFMTGVGHGTWNAQYNRPDFFPWFLSQKKNKIMVRYDRNLICPGESASVVMGFSPGLQAYEWRKDGQLISGATTNTITATSFGSYTGRIRNRNVWSEWSEPVIVGSRPASVTPDITVVGSSLYMPDINGTSAVKLSLPTGYATYTWNKQGDAQPVGSTQQVTVTSPGTYRGTITEVGGCVNVPSIASNPVTVIDATGAAPSVPKNLQAAGASLTSINLTWEDDPNPTLNEIGFEVYRSDVSGGPYALVATVGADVLTYVNSGLIQNQSYYYKVRAISSTGASAGTAEVVGVSQVDTTPPSAPYNVTKTDIGTTAAPGIRLNWPAGASTDNVGVVAYEIYQREFPSENWQKVMVVPASTTTTQQPISNLTTGKYYSFIVKAKDAAGNLSGPSTEWGRNASFPTFTAGVVAKYYKTTSAAPWNVLPNFDALTPTNTSNMSNFTISVPSGQPSDYFGYRYDAAIAISTAATYTFFTQSDEGSRLYINNQLVVDNDGLHTSLEKSGTITLSPGYYPIRVEYFDKTSSNSLTVRWQATSIGIAKGTIPNASLIRDYNQVAGLTPLPGAPATPSSMAASATSYNSINVSWVYQGPAANIELQKSTNGSTWTMLATVPGTTTSYVSTGLNASTRYYYRARAINLVDDGSFSSTVNAITQALPALPAAPSGLVASNITPSSVTLNWTDNASNETNYEIYKSSGDNTSYTKLTTLGANVTTAADATLFAHTTYFYKVLAKNVSGNSAYSNEITFQSSNSTPTLNGVSDLIVRHSDTYSIPLTATDADGDLIIIGSNNLPSFAQIFDYADGTGEIVLSPTVDDAVQGVFPGIQVFAKDLFGGTITKTFSITVNNNHPPVLSDPGVITLKESFKSVVNIVATDDDNDALTWTIENVPAFVIPTTTGNTTQLRISPALSDAGTYNINLSVKDPTGAVATRVVTVNVTNYNPNFKVYVNVRQNDGDLSTVAPAPWNDYAHGIGTLALNNETGGATGFTINVAGGGWQSGKAGKIPGIYPDPVNRSYMFFQASSATDSRTVTIAGLNPDGKYNVRILSSRTGDVTNNRTGIFSINGGAPQQLQANENASTLLNFNAQTPNASGQFVITVKADMSGTGHYALVNAVVLESYFDDLSVPDAPTSLALNVVNSEVRLSWVDNSINESGFEVHRSTDNVNFTKVTTTLPDVTTYTDPSVVAGQTYYYKVFAANNIGLSDATNVVTVVGPNHAPVIIPMPQIVVGEEDMQWIEINATDADNDPLLFDLVDSPPFVWLNQIDENSTLLAVSPYPGDAGDYTFQISATDINGATTLGTLSLFIGQIGE
ncbi:MAG TPA: fibronectin type III domain-containing protein, partial [Cyclobacteriaceae bacterium]|nr:fibronectin type III domain-containing protein [Cyclobacteriaceae bacterium]